ncbi:MAG: translocation/assembly module TamB domain-containing protein [Acidobacteriaceae bacterium]
MTDNPPVKTRRLRWRHAAYAAAAIIVIVAACVAVLFWYASTPQFSARVHRMLVSTLERTTGGRVEIRSFQWNARRLTVQIDDLTIHGREAPGEAPYFHVDHLTLQARIISFFTPSWIPEIALASLTAQHPTFHLIVYPDGTTNQPQPRTASNRPLPETLLSLEIGNTRVENGMILLNNRAIPWEMAAGPLQLTMRYVALEREYRAALDARNITFRLKKDMEAQSRLRAEVSLGRDMVRIDSLDLRTGNSRLQVTGELQNFSRPSWQTFVHGSIDARQVGAITGETELRDGTAQISIHAHGESQPAGNQIFQVTGHVDLHSGAWQASWLRLRNVDLHTDLIVDNDQCSLMNFSSLLDDGGRITGSLVMKHCVGPSAPVVSPAVSRTHSAAMAHSRLRAWMEKHPGLSPRQFLERLRRNYIRKRRPPQPENAGYRPLEADMQAQVSNVTLPLILEATSPKQYWNIGFTTATSGKVTAHWTGDGNGLDVRGDLTMHAPRRLMGMIPVTGSAVADYLGDHRHLVITRADENTPATSVHAAGLLTLLTSDPKSDLRMDVTGNDLGEFDRLLKDVDLWETPAGQPHALPVQLFGNATFQGDVHGSFFALEALGHMDAQRFQMIFARSAPLGAPPQAAPPVHLVTWDQFHGDFSYKPSELVVRNAELVRGATAVHTEFELSPQRTGPGTYTYDRRTRITGSVRTRDASIADLQAAAGTAYPATGTLTLGAYLTGTAGNLTGAGHLILTDSMVQRQEISRLSTQIIADGHLLQASDIQLIAAHGNASGKLSYNYQSGALQGEMTGQHFALRDMAVLQQPRLAVDGTLGFHVQANGTAASPIGSGGLEIGGLTLNRQPMGRLHADAQLQGGILHVTSRADLMKTHLEAGGQIQLTGNDSAQMEMTFAGFNINPLLRMISPNGIGGNSSLDGHITLSGPLKQPAAIQADADFNAFTATIDRLPIHSEGPVRVSLRDGKLQLQQLHIQGEKVNLIAAGTVDLLNKYRLRLYSEGSIDTALASAFDRNIESSGQLRFVLNARGTARQPDLRGTAQVSHVNVHLVNVTNGLTDMNGEMMFDQDRLVVQQLQGSSGGGALALTGFVGYRNGIFVDLTAAANQVRIRYPKGVSTSVDAKLRLLGTSDSLLLSGNVKAMRFGIGSSVDLTSFATGSSGVSAPIDPTSPLNRVRLDVHVTSAPELGFQNSFASLAGDVNLRIRGTLENPSILGRIDITEGSASFAGTKYKLQQGDITFSNPVTIAPEINLEASARVQNYDIIISLHGPPSKLNISYRSEPPLTQADVLALLALGRTNEQATMYGEQQQAGANLTSEALLGGALNAAVSSRVQKLFGVGSVRVDPNFVGTLGESTARVTVEEQVGTRLTLTFATNVNTTAQQLIQGQFDLTRNVSIIAVRDEADVFSAYLQIRGRHK